jgi:hypothetical protein
MSSLGRKLLAAAVLIGLGVVVTRYSTRRRVLQTEPEPSREFDLIDEASDQSFPASDAPSWTPRT